MWTKVDLTVDSGAVNTVGPSSVAPKIEMVEGEAKKKGVRYRVANGDIIPNEGEKRLKGFGDDYGAMGVNMQIADVTNLCSQSGKWLWRGSEWYSIQRGAMLRVR